MELIDSFQNGPSIHLETTPDIRLTSVQVYPFTVVEQHLLHVFQDVFSRIYNTFIVVLLLLFLLQFFLLEKSI